MFKVTGLCVGRAQSLPLPQYPALHLMSRLFNVGGCDLTCQQSVPFPHVIQVVGVGLGAPLHHSVHHHRVRHHRGWSALVVACSIHWQWASGWLCFHVIRQVGIQFLPSCCSTLGFLFLHVVRCGGIQFSMTSHHSTGDKQAGCAFMSFEMMALGCGHHRVVRYVRIGFLT